MITHCRCCLTSKSIITSNLRRKARLPGVRGLCVLVHVTTVAAGTVSELELVIKCVSYCIQQGPIQYLSLGRVKLTLTWVRACNVQ